jgi:shikimate kinase
MEIFDEMGENRFRELETAALCEVAAMSDVIVSCGGGTPCHGDNMALMNQAGITVWLTTSPERITARLLLPEQRVKRPKFNDLPDEAFLPLVQRELERRSPYYNQASLQFDSTDIETAPATVRTANRLATLLQPLLRQMTKN